MSLQIILEHYRNYLIIQKDYLVEWQIKLQRIFF